MEDYDCDKIGIPEDLRPKPISKWDFGLSESSSWIQSVPSNPSATFSDRCLTQFMSQERHFFNFNATEVSVMLVKAKIVPGTLFGQIYKDKILLYNLLARESGIVDFMTIGSPSISVADIRLDSELGILSINWKDIPGSFDIIVHYEYNVD